MKPRFLRAKAALMGVGLAACSVSALRADNGIFGPPFAAAGSFSVPSGLAVDAAHDRVLVADTGNHQVRYAAIADLASTPVWSSFGYVSDRALPEALNLPQALAVDSGGNAYVVDTQAGEVQLYRYSGGGYSLDEDFTADTRNSYDGVPIRLPRDIAVGGTGERIYLLDSGNNRILVADGPDDRSWDLFHAGTSWANPYGIDVATDGTVFVADTSASRIIRISGGTETALGSFGTGAGQLRHPRDVAVVDDGRLFVADTHNYRITMLNDDGSPHGTLGAAPLFASLEKIEVDASGRVYVVDSGSNRILAYLGPGSDPPFDAYVRDHREDLGEAATPEGRALASPDILIRHARDIDLATATANGGLQDYVSQQPRFGQNNYVYLAVRNRGRQEITGVVASLFYADPNSPLVFPDDWRMDRFFESFASEVSNVPGNTLLIPQVPASDGADGVAVIGPLIWRPLPGFGASGLGRYLLMAQLEHPDDLAGDAAGLAYVRENNNVAIRPVSVAQGNVPVGEQDVLVVQVEFPDIDTSVSETLVTGLMEGAGIWLDEITYGLVGLDPTYRGPLTLPETRDYYLDPSRSPLVEMTEDVLEKLLGDEAGILEGPTDAPEDDIDRIVLFVNDATVRTDWATTGTWPYELPGGLGERHLSVSVHGPATTTQALGHGLSHQLGLRDLYAYDNVIELPEELLPSGWDNMALPSNGVHPLTWSKELAGWVTESGARIQFIPRPGAHEPPFETPDPIALAFQSIVDRDQIGAIAVGMTEGAASLEEERYFTWIEARAQDLGNSDAQLPGRGVIIYSAHDDIPQGQGPVLMLDADPLVTGVQAIASPGSEVAGPGDSGIQVEVVGELPDDGGYSVRVEYAPPDTAYNLWVETGAPSWTSPDIWIDNQRDGGGFTPYDEPTQRLLEDPVDENPVEGEDNRIYARVHNEGPGTAEDVRVIFKISAPYHTVGGEGDFDLFGHVIIDAIPAGEHKDVFVRWRPETNDQHNCVTVDLENIGDDTDDGDNHAQQNFTVMESSTASPFAERVFKFHVTNPYDERQLMYFRADGVPAAWSVALEPSSYLFEAGERISGELRLRPATDAPICTDHPIYVTSWLASGDTLNEFGGTTVNLGLRDRTNLGIRAEVAGCDDDLQTETWSKRVGLAHVPSKHKHCAVLTAFGCTAPPRPNETLEIRYRDPAGNPVYHQTVTDADGCYDNRYSVVEGGDWDIQARYGGDRCLGSAEATVGIFVPIAVTGDQDSDGLPDANEVQGDDDFDGIPNHLDQDSDGDGLPDGEEPPGNVDGDSLVNVVDPDSDNDGVPDGEDPAPYEPGRCACSEEKTSLGHWLAAIGFVVAVLLVLFAYLNSNRLLGVAASSLLVLIAAVGLIACFQVHLWVSSLLIVLGILIFQRVP
jgi:hypothetical protein